MKRLFKLLILIAAFILLKNFCLDKTDGFTVMEIRSKCTYDPNWEIDCPPLPNVFAQPFTYLGTGGQCYAFASLDGKYVLKFFKNYRPIPLFLEKSIPGAKKRINKWQKKRNRDLLSYKISMEVLPEETGLLYAHLNPTNTLCQTAQIVDKLNITHQIPLDEVCFVLQKRATLAYDHLGSLISEGHENQAKEALSSICDLIITRCRKGIYDEDPRIHCNLGFIGNRAILIDVGRLRPDPRRLDPKIQERDLKIITARLHDYLKEISPELATYLTTCLKERQHD